MENNSNPSHQDVKLVRIAQLVERLLAKEKAVGSYPISHSYWGVVQARPNNLASCYEKRGSIPLRSTKKVFKLFVNKNI